VFVFADAPIEAPAEPLTVLWATWRDEMVGVITDPPGTMVDPRVDPTNPDVVRLHHVGTIQKALIHEQVAAITGSSTADVSSVLDGLTRTQLGTTMIAVDGAQTAADTVTYAGFDFALGRDIVRAPFAILRESPANGPWPDLATTC
jgi:hypothetical protein